MKKIILIILVISMFITGCTSGVKDNKDEASVPKDNLSEEKIDDTTNSVAEEVESEEEIEIASGKQSPDFTLKNLEGEDVSLSDFRGKIVLINFWATWCSWCDVEMPDLQKLDDENDDLVVLAVNVMEDKDTVKKYMEDGGYSFEVVFDEEGEIATTYLVNGLPNSYFVDEEGILLGGVPGMMTYEQMVEILENIREGK
ncbi:TlpA disulfide reductase family protein [Tissierella sp.]|uniref:TlpA family protein disulfide reductase n=1 Tax=Tissierella sp. TaxID=41274 RepID=UPI00285C5D49|nr:TlpA disulfide reductase family protein [Tissierella sp.]MDR7855588.1 TlpA disulfide reductase family protein [Tissierella sp.]